MKFYRANDGLTGSFSPTAWELGSEKVVAFERIADADPKLVSSPWYRPADETADGEVYIVAVED